MSQAPAVAFAAEASDRGAAALANPPDLDKDRDKDKAAVTLRGTTRGLEITIGGAPSVAALHARLTELLAEAPSFFAGCEARVAFAQPLPGGALACLEDVATRFQLTIVEIGPVVTRRSPPPAIPTRRRELGEPAGPPAAASGDSVPAAAGEPPAAASHPASAPELVPEAQLSSPYEAVTIEDGAAELASSRAVARSAREASGALPGAVAPGAEASAATAMAALADTIPPGARVVVGPVRSGVIIDHPGHVVVIGDVNPGAEIRAEGSIIVLGRMRGVAHAAADPIEDPRPAGTAAARPAVRARPAPNRRATGFIVALSLSPQQLRIGRIVARAADADRPSGGAEIAYATGETIVVERFSGRLPSGLAASM